jgi:hypothetical protein
MSETTKRRTHLTAQIKPSTKHALMLWLASAAAKIEEQAARLAWWEEHHEQAVADALSQKPSSLWWIGIGAFALGFVAAVVASVLA